MRPLLNTSIPPVWSSLRAARASVREALAQCPSALVDAAAMAACELLENAVKYGEEVPEARAIRFTLGLTGDRVELVTVNGCTDQGSIGRLLRHVRSLRDAPSKEALYVERLQEMLLGPSEGASLGIYRIALEGGFELDAACEGEVVTVRATRRIYG